MSALFTLPLPPMTVRGVTYRQCIRAIELCPPQAAAVRHEWDSPGCDCLRRPVLLEHQAKSSGSLATPGSAGLDARRAEPPALHQGDCYAGKCGGDFTCEGCSRVVGWCMGAGDDIGAEHCDDCYCDRLAVLELIKSEGQQSRTGLRFRVGDKSSAWRRNPVTVARELCEDGFLQFNGAGRFALTPRGREALT